MAKRKMLRIEPARNGRWILKGQLSSGVPVSDEFGTQRAAIEAGRYEGRQWFRHGFLAQLVCHGRSGKILWEATYGEDPRRYKS